MVAKLKHCFLCFALLLLGNSAYSQSPTCDIPAIRAAFAAQGHYVELTVAGQPCSLYFINTNSQDAAQSEVEANSLGAHTAVFDDAVENTNVNNAINAAGFGGTIWIGYHRTGTNSPTFYALDGTTGNFNVPTQAGIYQNWAGGEPNNNGYQGCASCTFFCGNTYKCQNGEQCVQIYANGQWNDLPCNDASISLVEVNLCPVSTATANQTICSDLAAPLTTTNGLLGSSPYSYAWTPTANVANPAIQNTTASPTNTTAYTVTITDRYLCTGSSICTVTVNTANANAGNDVAICAGANTQLTAAAGGTSYSWAPAGGLSNPNIANPTAAPGATTTYTVSVLGANGCTGTDDVIVTVNPVPVANAGNDAGICVNGSAFFNATGAGVGGSYAWTPIATLSDPAIANPVASPTTTTVYTLTVTDANSCISTDNIIITVNPLPTADAGLDQNICLGSPANLLASGGVSYAWTPAASLDFAAIAGPVATPVTTTTYTVTVTDANNCSATDDVIITVNPLPVADAGSDVSICTGLGTNLAATGGITFSWSPAAGLSATNIANPIANPAATTTYTVTVTDINNCQNIGDVIVTVNSLPLADAGTDVAICANGSAFMNGSGGVLFAWSPVTGLDDPTIANPVATPTVNTTYTLTVTDANNCQDIADVDITVNPLPVPSAGLDQAVCVGGSANLSSSGYSTYVWSPAATLDNPNIVNPVATPLATTTYTVTVTDINNCNGSDDVIVTVNPLPPADAGGDVGFCDGLSVGLSASGGVSYSWAPATGLSATNIPNPVANPLVTTTYTVTVTDANTCVNTDDIDVTVNPLPVADAGLDVSICFGASAPLAANAGFSAYAWTPTIALAGANTMTPTASPANTVTYTVNVTDANGCQDTDDIIVTVSTPPATNAGIDKIICYNGSVTLQGNGNGTIYSWTPTTDLSDPTILSPVASPKVTTTYTLTITDANNCSASDQVDVTVNPTPFVNFTAENLVCLNDSVQFTTTGICTISSGSLASFLWDFGEPLATSTAPNPYYTYSSPGVFTVNLSVTSDLGCTHDTTLTAHVNPLPQVVFTGTDLIGCVPWVANFTNGSTIATGSTLTSYHWDFGNGLSTNTIPSDPPVISSLYNVASNYTVSLTAYSDSGCSASLSIPDYVTTYPQPVADFVFDPNPGDIIFASRIQFTDITAGDPLTWDWNFGQGGGTSTLQNPYFEYSDTGHFDVRLVVENGFECPDTVTKTVYVAPSYTLYVPNSFTPGGDKVNELFFAKGIGVEKFDMVILDRWGHEVFHTRNLYEGWDGTMKDTGKEVKQDYYTYQISIRDYKDYPYQHRGTVFLVR